MRRTLSVSPLLWGAMLLVATSVHAQRRAAPPPPVPEVAPVGAGWYYDDFSDVTERACGAGGRRMVFTASARPPAGTISYIDCPFPCTTSAECPSEFICDTSSGPGLCVEPGCAW